MLRSNFYKSIVVVMIGVAIVLSACSPKQQQDEIQLTVSVAASISGAMEEVVHAFEQEHPNISILLNVGSSGGLQQQIAQGAPADLFLSAAEDKMELLLDQGLIDEEYVTPLLTNKLVLVVPVNDSTSVSSFDDLNESISKIAIGTPESVPAGMYAKQTLVTRDLYDLLEDKLVYGKDARQVLTYVETESVQAGVVYSSDATKSDLVNIVDAATDQDHIPIIYPAGIVANTDHHQQAVEFYHYLISDQAMEIFKKYGFIPLEADKT